MTPDVCDRQAALAAIDVLVLAVLQRVGRSIRKRDRARWASPYPLEVFHCQWQPDPKAVGAALADTWPLIPHVLAEHAPHLTEAEIRPTIERYVRELIAGRRGHSTDELRWMLEMSWR